MPQSASFQRFTFRVVLLKVSPLVVRLVSVPDDLTLDELHEVLQLTFGWAIPLVLQLSYSRSGDQPSPPFEKPPAA